MEVTNFNSDINQDDIEIKVSHENDAEFMYFTELRVDIMVKNEEAGHINAVLIDRSDIPYGYFLSEMDDYSADTQWLSVVLFEPKAGRTRLKSLIEHDDSTRPFMYIKTMEVHPEFRHDGHEGSSSYSNVGTFALRKLMHHPFLSDVATAIYVADGCEAMSRAEREDCDQDSTSLYPTDEEKGQLEARRSRVQQLCRKDANQFLRNGFFQDKAYATSSDVQSNILVASDYHWTKPIMSQSAAEQITFHGPSPESKGPAEDSIDAKLLKVVKEHASETMTNTNSIWNVVRNLITQGASVTQSRAFHTAVAVNDLNMVTFLLGFDPKAIDACDDSGNTPLMVAATIAAGLNAETNQMIEFLLAKGASKDKCDSSGMTAYGKYLHQWMEFQLMTSTMMGGPPPSSSSRPSRPAEIRLIRILVPDSGPTDADMPGFEEANSGFVVYESDDDNDDSNDDGDY